MCMYMYACIHVFSHIYIVRETNEVWEMREHQMWLSRQVEV